MKVFKYIRKRIDQINTAVVSFFSKRNYVEFIDEEVQYLLKLTEEDEKYKELYVSLMNSLKEDLIYVRNRLAIQYVLTVTLCFVGVGLVSSDDLNITISFIKFTELEILKIIYPLIILYNGLRITSLIEHKHQKLSRLDAMQDGYYDINGFHARLRPYLSYSLHDQLIEVYESNYDRKRRVYFLLNYVIYSQGFFFLYYGTVLYMYYNMAKHFMECETSILGFDGFDLLIVSFLMAVYLSIYTHSRSFYLFGKSETKKTSTLGKKDKN